MSKKCPICERGIGVYQDYVGGTSFFKCDICGHTGCDFEDMTIFDQITQSYETLAETLVYCEQPEYQFSCASWRSVVLGSTSYARKSEAFAATVARLKEVTK